MKGKEYINYNGKLLPKNQPLLNIDNRSFRYGDGLFESMHSANNKIQFLEHHLQRLIISMEVLKMEVPSKFRNIELMQDEINTLNNKNLHFKGSRIRLSVFRESGGLYSPKTNKVSYIIESKHIESKLYTLNRKGLLIDVYDEQLKPINLFSFLKSANSLFFVMAAIYKQANNFDECLILNTRKNVVESIGSNVFIVKKGKICTPPLTDACLPGIMRKNVIALAKSNDIEIDDSQPIQIKDIEEADEIFLTNAVKGVQWVVGFRQRRFYNHTAKKITEILNHQEFMTKTEL